MRKKEKNYSIIVVTGATSTNKEFVISSKLIKNSIIAFFVLLLIFGFIIFDYLKISFDKEEMKRLGRDNVQKEKTIAQLNSDFREIDRRLKIMEEYKKRISVVIGLTSPDSLKEVGVGGPLDTSTGIVDVPSGQVITDQTAEVAKPQPTPTNENILENASQIRQKALNIQNTLKFIENVMEDQKVRLASTPSIWPTKGYLTSPLGQRIHPLTGKRSYHNGQDIATQYGNKVIAPANGVVLIAEYRDYYGNLLIVDHGFGFTTRYGHLASFNVKEGQRIKRGQVVGFVGNTGRSSAPHLHYEVRYFGIPQNPMNFIID